MKLSIKNFWQNISFRKKMILYTSMLLYVFILLLGLLIYNRAVQTFRQMSDQSALERLQSLDESVKSRLNDYSSIPAYLLLDQVIQEKISERPSSFTRAAEFDDEIYSNINSICSSKTANITWNLYLSEMKTLSKHGNILPLGSAAESDWFAKLKSYKRNTIIWLLEPGEDGDPCRFICAVGVHDKNSTSLYPAYFKMDIDIAGLVKPIRSTGEDIDGIFLLCSPDGNVCWCSKSDLDLSGFESYLSAVLTADPLVAVNCKGKLGERSVIKLDGEKYGYLLICIRNSQTPMSKYVTFSRYFLAVTVIIMLFSLVILLTSNQLVGGRIDKLTRKIRDLDENDLNVDLDLPGNDEASELSRAFSGLLERIKALIERERLSEIERFELEIKALQSQINPHFLFNSLSVINLLAREIDADNISQSIEALSNFYRLSLQNSEKTITLRNELDMLDNYLKICSIRYRGKLSVVKSIDPDTLDCVIPKLIIQPFCENAVFHGFSPDSDRFPELSLTSRLENNDLLFIIADNGEGMTAEELENARFGGFAISNVDRRIKMFYDDSCGVTLESEPGVGTIVTLRLRKTVCPPLKNDSVVPQNGRFIYT